MTEHFPALIIALPLVAAFLLPLLGFAGYKAKDLFITLVLLVVNLMLFL